MDFSKRMARFGDEIFAALTDTEGALKTAGPRPAPAG